ncbi:MAG: DUF2786 domain-containing protein, partial [Acidimicrobiales bacterium]
MGVHNRERRQKKKAKRDRQRHAGASAGRAQYGRGASLSFELGVALAIGEAAEAAYHRRDDAAELLELLVDGPPVPGGRRMVARELEDLLLDEVQDKAIGHWRPSEILRQVRRKGTAAGEEVVLSVARRTWRRGGDGVTDPAWATEAASLDPTSWRIDPAAPTWPDDVGAAVGVLGILSHLPSLPECRPGGSPNGWAGATAQGRVLEKVRHLLSKAESTTFPDEAEALTAKAQELLARYSIDRAMVEGSDPARGSEAAVRRIWVDEPYLGAKAQLLHVVAMVNRCRSVLTEPLGLATVAGHEDDLDTVETLFTSLLVQATTQMTASGSRTDSDGRSRTRSFRQSFLLAFAIRIGHRLESAEKATVAAATETHGNALVPVLASRMDAADEAIAELFPTVGHRGAHATNSEGWMA